MLAHAARRLLRCVAGTETRCVPACNASSGALARRPRCAAVAQLRAMATATNGKDFYAVLGVPPSASAEVRGAALHACRERR
jgi:hypothetical protein